MRPPLNARLPVFSALTLVRRRGRLVQLKNDTTTWGVKGIERGIRANPALMTAFVLGERAADGSLELFNAGWRVPRPSG